MTEPVPVLPEPLRLGVCFVGGAIVLGTALGAGMELRRALNEREINKGARR